MDFSQILNFKIVDLERYELTVAQAILALIIFFMIKGLLLFVRNVITRRLHEKVADGGKAYALFQLLRYLFWMVGIVIIMDVLNIKVTYLLAGGAALFVGLGLGLQDVFKDVVAGILMLVERNVAINDVMEVDGSVGRVTRIGIRTSTLKTRDGISLIVPNSKFINDKVVNWSNESEATRFDVKVGVAYGSDEKKVHDILMKVASDTEGVLRPSDGHPTLVRLIDFGESSLDFQLLFWTRDIFPVENTRSTLRFKILDAFRANKIEIPFPQRDLHVKTIPQSLKNTKENG